MNDETKIRILIIDDNPLILKLISRFLQSDGHLSVVGTAMTGDEALAQANELRPEVMLVDLNLAGKSGLEVIQTLRAQFPSAGLIALTVMGIIPTRVEALHRGADAFVEKVRMDHDLVPAIMKVAERHAFGSSHPQVNA